MNFTFRAFKSSSVFWTVLLLQWPDSGGVIIETGQSLSASPGDSAQSLPRFSRQQKKKKKKKDSSSGTADYERQQSITWRRTPRPADLSLLSLTPPHSGDNDLFPLHARFVVAACADPVPGPLCHPSWTLGITAAVLESAAI